MRRTRAYRPTGRASRAVMLLDGGATMGFVCTVVMSFAPDRPAPVLLLGVRDEFADRPWQPPAAHWAGLPVTGGRDLRAGGTWLAVNPGVPRAACVLNGRGGAPVPAGRRRSRGDLPLLATSEGLAAVRAALSDRATLERYDAFHLVAAEASSVTVLSWDGTSLAERGLWPATHVYTNAGHAYASAPRPAGFPEPAPGPGARPERAGGAGSRPGSGPAAPGWREPRAAYFGPLFAARRPSGDPRGSLAGAWNGWLELVDGEGLDLADPRALIVRRRLADGRVWGSSSVSLVALGGDGGDGARYDYAVRYDFRAVPAATGRADAGRDRAAPGAGRDAWRAVLP